MLNSLSILSLFLAILVHPLEKLDLQDFINPQYNTQFINGNEYIMPVDGYLYSVNSEDGLFTVTIKAKEGGKEYIYCGLTDIYHMEGNYIRRGEIIGKDISIDENTKYFFMLYNNAVSFPQFRGNTLTFLIPKGTKTFLIANGSIVEKAYDSQMGIYIKLTLSDFPLNIYYKHLGGCINSLNGIVPQGELIGYTNSTGAVSEPQLVILFEDEDKSVNYRIIYGHL